MEHVAVAAPLADWGPTTNKPIRACGVETGQSSMKQPRVTVKAQTTCVAVAPMYGHTWPPSTPSFV